MSEKISSFAEYLSEYKKSIEQPEKFWASKAESFTWEKKWDKVLEWNFIEPSVKWFIGGKLNITKNCLDRHLETRGNQTAILWEPNNPGEESRKLTYKELHIEVCRAANMLLNNGAKKGDRICIYMPMVPELAIAVLACARIGAVHSVVFAGFAAGSLTDRINDAACSMVLTADGAFRGAKDLDLKSIVDDALTNCPSVKRVIVLRRTGGKVIMKPQRDVWWKDEIAKANSENQAEVMDSEDMLFILYTSGSTGKPKGVVHSCGGYMVYADYSFRNVFQYQAPPPPKGGSFQSSIPEVKNKKRYDYETADPVWYGLLKNFVKENRSVPTEAEKVFWDLTRGKKIGGHKFRRQHIIGPYIADFVSLPLKLIIEIDGLAHQLPENISSDLDRTDWLNKQGFKVIRFSNKEVIANSGGVLAKLEVEINARAGQFLPLEGRGAVYWCTADIGWITGHTYIVYGPLLAGGITMMFEGIPTHPDAGRFWQTIDKHKVNIFYTAPTAIRSLQAMGLDFVKPYKLDSLRILGSVGEPINEEAWHWYNENIGKKNCPIVDTWWQTETGGILISPLAGITKEKPSYATLPLPGIQPVLVDEKGNELIGNNVEGRLCFKFPWPSMIRTTYGNHERCRENYFSQFKGYYFTGDGCKRDENGYYRITGRVDDVIKVSGHLLGTAEIENAINQHKDIVESAVVGFPHDIKGWGIYAFVIDEHSRNDREALKKEIAETVTKIMGPIARPDKIQIVKGLPKTRSGKIMRRILRKIAEGDVSNLGDTSTLLDPGVVEEIKSGAVS